jgi:L-aminopeptidase/D-esterase-like protein
LLIVPSITDVEGIRVGHWSDESALTGCTVVLPPMGTVASCEVRGGAPGTRGTDMLQPGTLLEEAHAIVLTGGSAFGLAAASGVERYLEERGIGSEIGNVIVPSVAAAVIFDLGVGDPTRRPGSDEGYAACLEASTEAPEGRIGAGTGATVAKLWGPTRAVPGGLGTWAVQDREVLVGALFVVNAVGEIIDEDGSVLAGPRLEPGERREDLIEWMRAGNTTIGVVATNAKLTKAQVSRMALMADDGYARAIAPSHTSGDGDTIFSLATGRWDGTADLTIVGALAAEAMADAVVRAATQATSVAGIPAARDLKR